MLPHYSVMRTNGCGILECFKKSSTRYCTYLGLTYLILKPRRYKLHRRCSVRCYNKILIVYTSFNQTNRRRAVHLKFQCCDFIGWKNVDCRNFVVLSYAHRQELLHELKWSWLKYRYVTIFTAISATSSNIVHFVMLQLPAHCTAVQITNKTLYCTYTLEILFV